MQHNSMLKESLKGYFPDLNIIVVGFNIGFFVTIRTLQSVICFFSIVKFNQSVYYLSFKKMYVYMRFTHVYGGHNA